MANTVYLLPTTFIDARTNAQRYGFRMFDQFDRTYCDVIDDKTKIDSDIELLREASKNDDPVVKELVHHLKIGRQGLYIGSKWYPYETICHVLA